MGRKLRRFSPLFAAVVLAAGIFTTTAGSSVSSAANASAHGVSQNIPLQAQQHALSYWTAARMQSAKPYPMSVTQQQVQGQGSATPTNVGTPSKVDPQPPAGMKVQSDEVPASTSTSTQTCCPGAAYNYPAPYTRNALLGSLYKKYPYRTNGKVFFTQNGTNFVCSATAVSSSASNNIVETAGHCVNDGSGHFDSTFTFVPAYKSGTRPFGTWTASQLWTWSSWSSSGDLREDRGFAVIAPLNGNTLYSQVGSEGIAFNQSYLQGFTDFGWPQASPFNGATEQVCYSSTEETDPFDTEAGSVPLGIGCDQTGGSSGGGWVIQFSQTSGGFVNGHNDYKYTSPSRPQEMFSPYFDNNELALWNCAVDNVC